MKFITRIFLNLTVLFISCHAYAQGTLIPAANRVDMVHDFSRNIIYISNGSQILRYDVQSSSFLSPYDLGGTLLGMDISPDGNTLAVADSQNSPTESWIHLVNLFDGTSRKASFARNYYDGGTWTVAYGSDNSILVTSRFNGSGWVPLRRYDTTTHAFETISSVRQDTMITASGDANIIAYAESNISSGPVGKYHVNSKLLENGPQTGWFTFEIGVNNNGTHYSVPTYGGTYLFDDLWTNLGIIGTYAGQQPIGVVYHPVENRVFYSWARTTEVREFDTTSMTQVAAYNFENSFSSTGNHAFNQGRMKISRDGSLLMSTVSGGVRFVQLYPPLTATSQDLVTDEDTLTIVNLNASVGNGGTVNYLINNNPAHGTLSGIAPDLIYTPNENYYGQDNFSYQAVYGKAVVEASVNLTINPVNDVPVAVDDTIDSSERWVNIFVLDNDMDVDGDVLTITDLSKPVSGRAIISDDGQYILYRAKNRKVTADQFTYTVSDGNGGTTTANVSVNIIK